MESINQPSPARGDRNERLGRAVAGGLVVLVGLVAAAPLVWAVRVAWSWALGLS